MSCAEAADNMTVDQTWLMGVGMARGRTLRVVLVTVVVVVGLVVWSIIRALSPPSPPDVSAQANASGTRGADQRAAALMDSQLQQLRARTPWADQLGRSVVDLCRTRLMSAGVGGSWSPVSCQRTTTLYLAFDGQKSQRLAELDQILDAQGWQSPEQQGRPTVLSVFYTSRHAARADLMVGVSQVPHVPIDDWVDWPGSAGKPYQNDDLDRVVYLTWQPVNTQALVQATAHRYVAAFAFRSTYYAQPQPAPTPPRPPTQTGPTCRSGSGKCD